MTTLESLDTDKITPMMYDYIAYEVLTNETNKPYTALIISEITNMDYDYVLNNMKVVSNRHSISNKNNKRAISDIIIRIENTIINIEINKYFYNGVIEKSNYYYSKIIANSLKTNVEYKDMPRVIQINLNNFAVNNNTEKINTYLSIEKNNHDIELSKFIKYHVNIDKIKKEWYNNCKLTLLKEGLALFLIDSKKDLEKITKNKPKLERTREIIMDLNSDDYLLEGMEYDWGEESIKAHMAMLRDAYEEIDKRVEQAKVEAKIEADKQANERVAQAKKELKKELENTKKRVEEVNKKTKQAIEQAKIEAKKDSMVTTIVNMLKDGLPFDLISKYTNSSLEEIEQISLKINNKSISK